MSETSDNPPAESIFEPVPADGGTDAPAQTADAAAEIAAAVAEAAKNRDAYLRAMADFDNYRRRVVRERDDERARAVAGLLEDFLPVLDGLNLAASSAASASDAATLSKGVAIVADQFTETLARHGVERIEPAAGDVFDPNDHEAVAHAPSAEVAEGRVIQIVRPGYRIGRRLVRAASVVVSSGEPEKA
ncbi:MAG TPA: nucleotide exchange factor GrpE [Opitutaceae bacterium]|nr:nucleotide exchange factor GrpE [Opitutaceae bacterium]